jgi:glycosyltransferase involved in cell wall biosynthesis
MTPRVLLLFSSSELGGAERSLTQMALAEDPAAVDYTVATLDGEGPWTRWVRASGVTPLVFGRRRDGRHGRFGPGTLVRCLRWVRARRIEVVYVIGLRAALWIRLLKPWLGGAKVVQGVRWNPASRSRLDVVFAFVERHLWKATDMYVCNCRAAADTLAGRCTVPPARVRVIYNGVAAPPARPTSPPPPAPVVLTVANLSPRKGHLPYLDVVQDVVAAHPSVRFVFVGRDDMGGAVQRAIRDRGLARVVSVVGYQDDVSAWLRQARLFVLPSLWNEGSPTAILEAKAHAVPVVAYAVDGIPEVARDGLDSLLVAVGDRDVLAKTILGLLRDEAVAERLGAQGRASVAAEFSVEACTRGHRDAFAEVLGHAR